MQLSQEFFDCSDIGEHIVTLTVVDNNGNTDNCTATVTVVDKVKPSITCPGFVDFKLKGNETETDVVIDLPLTDDNCGVDIIEHRWRLYDPGTETNQGPWSSWAPGQLAGSFQEGYYKYQYEVTDVNGNFRRCISFFEVTSPGNSNLISTFPDQSVTHQEILVYPNPSSDIVHYQLRLDTKNEPVKINIYDIMGKIIVTEEIQKTTFLKGTIETSKWPNGTYIISVYSNGIHYINRFLVQH